MAHVEDTLQRQRMEMQMDKKWLEEEERQMVTTHTHTHNCYIAFHSFAKPNRKLSIFDL